MIVFTHTDLPEPVAPAMSRCGIFARSAMTGFPSRSLPSAIGSAARALRKSRVLDQLAEPDHLRRRIRHLDADGAAPGNRRDDADRRRAHREREVVREVRDLAHLHARRGLDLELRDDGSGRAADELALDLERAQRVHELHAHRVELALAERRCCAAAAALSRSGGGSSSLVSSGVSVASIAAAISLVAPASLGSPSSCRGASPPPRSPRPPWRRRRRTTTPAARRARSIASNSSGGGSSASATSTGPPSSDGASAARTAPPPRRLDDGGVGIGRPPSDDHAHGIPAQRRPP